MRVLACVSFASALAACGASPPPDAAAPARVRAERAPETRLVRRVEGLASLVAGADCPGYAERLEAWVDAHGEEVRALARQSQRAPSLPARDIEALEQRLAEALGVVVRGALACPDDRGAQTAFQGFSLLAMDTAGAPRS